ncbi:MULTISPECIES: acyl-CoA thioesterase [Halobacteriales]|uniref:Thioesterase n=3 Tax=Halobacteriales TaxID=2235 RepID=L0JTU9_NATP1|nr:MULTISPECIES: thioesterase family protein [Halobacteria]AGB34062.1 putative thioesterase [Natrinema pellirubrum DSM 15624]ELY69619.1 thioesterase superfamily protein [Natrinema pellirubrum DSM 15624]ELY77018.1 thioesterase superfamily protein [Natrinema pallidum DSM 3751]MCD2203798.1 acyl-CoA thioesterase [Halobacterium sp. KA-6]
MSRFTTTIDVRFRDIDAMGHVNNAVYATYLEQARVEYFAEVLGRSLDTTASVLASLSIDYRAPVELDQGSVTVAVDVPELGTSSIPMEYEIRTEEEIAATADTVQVLYDAENEESRPIPSDWRGTIESYHDL